jgi:hypothetical protein
MFMSNREMNTSNKKKGDGNGNSVYDNHEYSNKVNTASSQSSTNLNDVKSVKEPKRKR